jgi:hypothetical protein
VENQKHEARHNEQVIHLKVGYETAYRRMADRYATYFGFHGTVYSDYARATNTVHPRAGYQWIVKLVPVENGTQATIKAITEDADIEGIVRTLKGDS